MQTVALVDDDRRSLTSLSMALQAEGFHTQTYNDGASALVALQECLPDAVVLDAKLPRIDGMEVLRILRQKSNLPVIMVSSNKDEIDELFGLKMGADDFIRKPFSQRVLTERINAILRRVRLRKDVPKTDPEARTLSRGPLVMDLQRYVCTWKSLPVKLTVTEFLLLVALARRTSVVKSRTALIKSVYGDHAHVHGRIIDSHVKRLRKKLRLVDQTFDAIETVYGIGYRFRDV